MDAIAVSLDAVPRGAAEDALEPVAELPGVVLAHLDDHLDLVVLHREQADLTRHHVLAAMASRTGLPSL